MTYIARGTRIIDSRWLDECDVEYKLRAHRNRSEGRLKKHSSCDDVRAWASNDCDNYSYLLDLMSDGESTGKSHVRLYGRYIPVPVLFKIMQNVVVKDSEAAKASEKGKGNEKNKGKDGRGEMEKGDEEKGEEEEEGENEDKENLWKLECEKYLMEKRFLECKALLCKAVGKLERIECIVYCGSDEGDDGQDNEDVNADGPCRRRRQSNQECQCYAGGPSCSNLQSSPRESNNRPDNRCRDLLEKISDLRHKLRRIKDCRDKVHEQIKVQKHGRCSSNSGVTELFSRRDEARLKRLQKKLEKLIIGKGMILTELTQMVSCLNKQKKSKSCLSSRSKSTATNDDDFHCVEPVACACGCQCNDNADSSNLTLSEDISIDACSESTKNTDNSCYQKNECGSFDDGRHSGPVNAYRDDGWQSHSESSSTYNKMKLDSPPRSTPPPVLSSPARKSIDNNGSQKKKRFRFVCPQKACKRKSESRLLKNNHSEFYVGYHREQLNKNPFDDIANSRPSTSPAYGGQEGTRDPIPERKIKSETTMEEIEKALRNYEQRLDSLECLERTIKKIKEKATEGTRVKQDWMREKTRSRKLEAEREKSNREISRLCSENWSLKNQVQQLTAKAAVQTRKMECLEFNQKKLWEIKCEATELKKELSNYQESFDDQRKCIAMLEGIVADQKQEIMKLTSLIQSKTAAEMECKSPQSEQVQRSRSYSPESMRARKVPCRPSPQTHTTFCASSEDEYSGWYCGQSGVTGHDTSGNQQWTTAQKRCYTPQPNKRRGRCVN